METRTTINTKKCPNCGKDIDVNAVYCVHCKSTICGINNNTQNNMDVKSIKGNSVFLVLTFVILGIGCLLFLISLTIIAPRYSSDQEILATFAARTTMMSFATFCIPISIIFFMFYRISRVENWVKFFINTKK